MLHRFSGALRQHAPTFLTLALRRVRRSIRRRDYYMAKLLASQHAVTQSDLESAFRQVGLEAGDAILVHSAMSHLGMVRGGADTIVQALLEVITPSGTLLTPAFSVRTTMLERAQSREVFDVRNTLSQSGKLTETFRQYPGTVRSLHPTHSVVALGPLAEWLTADHHSCTRPFGPDTPFARLIEARGKIMCLGVEVSYMTSYHAFEDSTPDYPDQVYLPDLFQMSVVDERGRESTVETYVHSPIMGFRRIEKRPEILHRVKVHLIRTGRLTHAQIGKGEVHLIGAYELNEAMAELLREGVTIYAPQ